MDESSLALGFSKSKEAGIDGEVAVVGLLGALAAQTGLGAVLEHPGGAVLDGGGLDGGGVDAGDESEDAGEGGGGHDGALHLDNWGCC
ncbi:hypothetical protein PG991_001658 [Apiospora marii]|uniref:Uncharacterized protein n=1 Tax=Apiospora marii TaxID=335849 RepID=A0ABR1SQA8_9PEZI